MQFSWVEDFTDMHNKSKINMNWRLRHVSLTNILTEKSVYSPWLPCKSSFNKMGKEYQYQAFVCDKIATTVYNLPGTVGEVDAKFGYRYECDNINVKELPSQLKP